MAAWELAYFVIIYRVNFQHKTHVISVDSDLQWIKDSPQVAGDAVSADLVIGSSFCSVTCSVTGLPPQDCELALPCL